MTDNIDWAEEFKKAGEHWTDVEAAASLLEDTKSSELSRRMAELGDMAVSKAEMMVKKTDQWRQFVENIVKTRQEANKAKINVDYCRMKHQDWLNKDANTRAEMRL